MTEQERPLHPVVARALDPSQRDARVREMRDDTYRSTGYSISLEEAQARAVAGDDFVVAVVKSLQQLRAEESEVVDTEESR